MIDDFYFNAPQWISYKQQEFYATGLFADGVSIHLAPGLRALAHVLQLPAEAKDLSVQWSWADDSARITDGPYSVQETPPDLFSSFTRLRDGVNDTGPAVLGYRMPLFGPNASKINGEWNLYDYNLLNNFRSVGTSAPTYWTGQGFTMLQILNFLVQIQREVAAPRSPGNEQFLGEISGDVFVEYPGMYLLRLLIQNPEDAPAGDSANPVRWRMGWVAWGHK